MAPNRKYLDQVLKSQFRRLMKIQEGLIPAQKVMALKFLAEAADAFAKDENDVRYTIHSQP